MATPGIPNNFNLQTANQQNLVTWDITPGAMAYDVQRSTDGVTYAPLATPTLNQYLDTAVTVGAQYWYKTAALGGTAATLVADNITYTANDSGTIGNSVSIALVAGGTAGAEVVSIVGVAISVQIASGVSTKAQVVAALTASEAASALVYAATTSTGTPGLLSATFLSGGLDANLSSPYTVAQSCVPAPTGEMCLSQIRLQAQQRADRVNSQFVTMVEWNQNINQCLFELYDLLVTAYGEEYFAAPFLTFSTDGTSQFYDLPNGTNYNAAPAFYKLLGVDLGLNTSATPNNGWVTLERFNLIDRNNFYFPNTNSSQYGIFNMRYRLYGNKIEFTPTPSASQPMRLIYIPRMTMLLRDTDITTNGVSGWLEYVIVRSAILALAKEESDTSVLAAQLAMLTKRIEASSMNRDVGQASTISDTRGATGGRNGGNSGNWGAGW